MKNLGQMMKQAQKLQEKMGELQEQLASAELIGSSGGGMVEVTLSGKGDVRKLRIDPSLVDREEVEVLEDLIVAAMNDAKAKLETHVAQRMAEVTGGLKLPPGMQFPLRNAARPPIHARRTGGGRDHRNMSEIERLIQLLAKLPGLGPRSARRAALFMLKRRETVLEPLARALTDAANAVGACSTCGNLDTRNPCGICADARRDASVICVVEDVADLWALERSGSFRGRYHVLGGTLSAIEGVGPDDLNIPRLIERARAAEIKEVIVALSFTVDGQTTAHYLLDRIAECGVSVTGIAHGVPLGGELHYLDDATLATALAARRSLG